MVEIEAQMFSFVSKLNQRTFVEPSFKPAIFPNCSYQFVVIIF